MYHADLSIGATYLVAARGSDLSSLSSRAEAAERAWLEIDLAALRRNAAQIADRVAPARLLPMIKADAYGVGAVEAARTLEALDPWALGVATASEGRALRDAGVDSRIVVFTPCAPLDLAQLRAARLEPVAASVESLDTFARAGADEGVAWPIHLEIDTGMSRAGLSDGRPDSWLPDFVAAVRAGRVRVESTLTHFHSADIDPGETRAQWERYQSVLALIREAELDRGLTHAANGTAALRYPEYRADMVRPGLFLYGGGGMAEVRPEAVVQVRARVLHACDVDAGTTVSYGATYRTSGPTRLATIGIGYADGLPHAASGRVEVLLAGRRAPVRGAVCMDITVIEATDLPEVGVGAVATVLGRDAGEQITLSELARRCGTIEYEILTGFGRRLPRLEPEATRI